MDLVHIRYFLAIIDAGSFSAASYELCISQSCISKHILNLEEEVGVKLFNRNQRHVFLTPAGEKFYFHALKLIDNYNSMMEDMKDFSSIENGIISIKTIPIMSQYKIISLLALFSKQYPKIKVNIQELECHSVIRSLEKNDSDLVILRTNYLDTEQYRIWPIAYDELALVIPSSHPLANEASLSLEEFKNEDFIFLTKESGIYNLCLKACEQEGFKPNIVFSSSRIETIVDLITSGQGISLLMRRVVKYFSNPSISIIPLSKKVPSITALVKPRARNMKANEKLFVDFVKNYSIDP